MINFNDFYDIFSHTKLKNWVPGLRKRISKSFDHGDYLRWNNNYEELPDLRTGNFNFSTGAIKIGDELEISREEKEFLNNKLKYFMPWRKGPYEIFGIYIDTEWRSDFKWDRLKNGITPLNDRKVLDVGCGNGYHMWRMFSHSPKYVIGVDTQLLACYQFNTIKKYAGNVPVWLLPVGVEDIPKDINYFDTVFSMGVFYHRKSPFEHLADLKSFLRDGGELILETLVIDGKLNEVLVPEGRYAQMRNVWFIPTTLTLELWLKRAGFKNIELLDVSRTTVKEQRKTEWMQFLSLDSFLDHEDSNKTIEGYPAPKRAIFKMTK